MPNLMINNMLLSSKLKMGMEPPRVFISYRWENATHINWVSSFVKGLKKRGVTTFFDRDVHAQHGGEISSETLQKIISYLSRAHVFIPILTPAYLQGIGAECGKLQKRNPYDGWVFDEFQESLWLGKNKRQETIPVLRKGDAETLPYGFNSKNTLDMRDDTQFDEKLDYVVNYMTYLRNVETAPSDIFRSDPFSDAYAENLNYHGTNYFNLNHLTTAQKFFKRAIELTTDNQLNHATYLGNLALTENMLGNFDIALCLFKEALNTKILILGKYHQDVGAILNNLGLLYCDLNSYDESIKYLKQALSIKENLPNPDFHDIAVSCNSLAHAYHKKGAYYQALPYYEKAASIANEILPSNNQDVRLFNENLKRCRRECGTSINK